MENKIKENLNESDDKYDNKNNEENEEYNYKENDNEENDEENEEEYEEENEEEIEEKKDDFHISTNKNINEEFLKSFYNPDSQLSFRIEGGAQTNIYNLTSQFMNIKGWKVVNKDGSLIKKLTSLELFQFLTEDIIGNNLSLNNYYIFSENNGNYCSGDKLYLSLMDNLSSIFKNQKEKLLNTNSNNIFYNKNFNNINISQSNNKMDNNNYCINFYN